MIDLRPLFAALGALFGRVEAKPAPTLPFPSVPPIPPVTSQLPVNAMKAGQRRAALSVVRACEGTAGPYGYRTLFGGTLFTGFADHPRIRFYEKHDEFIRNGKVDYTTAAGAYQITESTYDRLMRKPAWISGPKPVRDFAPSTQDALAIELMAEHDALVDIDAGRIEQACAKLGGIWASLPTATVGQPKRDRDFVINHFVDAGGVLGAMV